MSGSITKAQLVKEFLKVVKMTRAGEEVRDMYLEGEYVIIQFDGGSRRAPVGGDSGIALMRDVLKYI